MTNKSDTDINIATNNNKSLSLIVIDDEKIITDFVVSVASKLGINADSINDAGMLEKHIDLINKSDILFIDLLMPGIDGIKLLNILSQIKCQSQIVLISGKGQRILEKTMSIGNNNGLNIIKVLQKPFYGLELTEILKQFIEDNTRIQDKESHLKQAYEPVLNKPTITEIKQALLDREFVPYFHPQINVKDGTIVGYEVLARWVSSTKGNLSPFHFIDTIENDPIILDFTLYIIKSSLNIITTCGIDYSQINLSINIPPSLLEKGRFVEIFEDIMQQYPLSNSQSILEITETSIPENINIANETINRIALRGHKISIDDFGTGHSSLEKLRDIMVDEIKIDKSFLKMISQQDTKRIVKNIISLANELNINIVAEGVETQDQLDEISEMGVDIIQGFYFTKPLSPSILKAFHDEFNENYISSF
jgi:EAL domain-containing protein (putative c-di-GMP-specific phosphodiesterase class I)/FixJ family two-component response regulator